MLIKIEVVPEKCKVGATSIDPFQGKIISRIDRVF